MERTSISKSKRKITLKGKKNEIKNDESKIA
jgi:hypothetical protein